MPFPISKFRRTPIASGEVYIPISEPSSPTHAGEWDMDKLAEWTADLKIDLSLDLENLNVKETKIKDMELIRYEKYDYVMIVCRNEIDHLNLTRALGIDDKKVLVSRNATRERKIKARAVWYDDIKAQIMPKKEKEQ